MKINTIFKTILLAVCMAGAVSSFASKEYSRTIDKSFTISNGGKVEIINKYGNIDIRPSDGNEVTFHIEIKVDANSQDKANDILNAIDVNFYDNRDYVKAETSYENMDKFWNKLKKWGNNSYEVNYFVKAPPHVELDLQNKYGNIHAEDSENDVEIDVKYGNFTLGSVKNLDLVIGYGNGEVVSADDVELDIKYGKLEIQKAQNVDVESKYSTVIIESAKEVVTRTKYDEYRLGDLTVFRNEGKYDKIRMEHVNDIRITTDYTNIEIEDIRNNGEFDLKYGSLQVHDLTSAFEEIDITSNYTDIRMESDSDASFSYDIDTEYVDLKVPSYDIYHEDGKVKEVKADKNGGNGGHITITAKYGSIRIK